MFGVTPDAANLSFNTLYASMIVPACLLFNGVTKIALASKWSPMSTYSLPRDDMHGKHTVRSIYALLVGRGCVM